MEEIVQLINAFRENPGEVTGAVQEMLSSVEVFENLFGIVNGSFPDNIKSYAVVFIGNAFDLQIQSIDESILSAIKEQILGILFTQQLHKEVLEKVQGITEKIFEKIGFENWPDLFVKCIEGTQSADTISLSLTVLLSILPFTPNEAIAENAEAIIAAANAATHSDSWEQRAIGFALFSRIATQIKGIELDIIGFIGLIFEYPHDATLFNSQATKKSMEKIWNSIDDIVICDLMPKEIYEQLLPLIFEIANDAAINVDDRLLVLHTIIGILTELDEEQLAALFNVIFELGKGQVANSSLTMSAQSILEVCFDVLDNEMVYGMLKERIEASFQQSDVSSYAFGIMTLSVVITFAPDIAVQDIEFLGESFKSALAANDDNLSEAVCNALNSLDDTFSTATVMCSSMLMSILPFLVSENTQLKSVAFSAVHGLCEKLDTEVEGFFQTAWELKDQIAPEDKESYTQILESAIDHADLGDEELDALLEYTSSFFEGSSEEDFDIDEAIAVLNVISGILKMDDTQAAELLPSAFELAEQGIMSTNSQTKTCVIDFIGKVYPFFHQEFEENFKPLVHKIRGIALSILPPELLQEVQAENQEEEEQEELPAVEGENIDELQSAAISTLAIVVKASTNAKLAADTARCIVAALNIKDETGSIAETAYEDAISIIKFLNVEMSRSLFEAINSTITKSFDPNHVAKAMKPYMKLVHRASGENQEGFRENSMAVLLSFFKGELPCLHGVSPLEGKTDSNLMVQVAYLISEVVRFVGPEEIEEICSSMLSILQTQGNISAYAYIGAFSDVVKFDKITEPILHQIFEILPAVIEAAGQDPDLQQNISFLLNTIVQKFPALVDDVMSIFPTIWGWFTTEVGEGSGWQLFLSNAASLFISLANTVDSFPEDAIVAAFQQFPPYDYKETAAMCHLIIKFFSTQRELSGDAISAAVKAIANLLLMAEADLTKRKITQELFESMKSLLKTILGRSEEAQQFLHAAFQKSRSKMAKLTALLQ